MQHGFYSWYFNKDSTHEQTNKTINETRKPNSLYWCKTNTETGTITHETLKEYGCLNMVPNQRQR